MPSLPGVGNKIDQPLYDTMQAAAVAAQTLSFFSVPVTGVFTAAIVKGFQHTNLVQAGRLERNIEALVHGVSFAVKPCINAGTVPTLADYRAIMNNGFMNMQFGQVSFLRVPLLLTPPGPAELGLFSNIAPAATEFKNNHGLASMANVMAFKHPLTIKPQETITVDVVIPVAVAAVTDLVVVLWAETTRPAR